MNSIKYIITGIFFFSLMQTSGQTTGISVTGGVGTYDLGYLKSYHNEIIEILPVHAKPGDYFPPYTNFKLNLFRTYNDRIRYGVVYGYSTTGAHANYRDYSGYLNFDQVITAYQFGVNGYYSLYSTDMLNLAAYADVRFSYVRDEVSLLVMTQYYFENSKVNFNAFSPFTEIGLEAYTNLPKFSLGVEAGYLLDAGVKFNTKNASTTEALVSLAPSSDLRTGMSGFRIGVKAILWLIPKEDQ